MTTRDKLLDAARDEIRKRGYAATSVDTLCAAAGVTKGAFFHYFPSKDALGEAAADHWGETTAAMFEGAPYHQPDDPLARMLAYIDFRQAMIAGDIAEFTCLAGTMAQEIFAEQPAIRAACWRAIANHAATLEVDIDAAIAKYGVSGVNAKSLALYTQAALQGAFILAKAKNDPALAREMIAHLRRYIELTFGARSPAPPASVKAGRRPPVRSKKERGQ